MGSHLCVDPNDLRSVGQLMVVEFMEVYATKVGIPRMIGRTRWYTNTNLARVIVGFHLSQVPEETSKKWSKDHHKYLHICRKDFAAWVATLPGYTGAPEPLTSGYAEAAQKTPAKATGRGATTGAGKPTGGQPRGPGMMPPPATVPPPRSCMLAMLQDRFKVGGGRKSSPPRQSTSSCSSVSGSGSGSRTPPRPEQE
jgi:hypothetical protein